MLLRPHRESDEKQDDAGNAERDRQDDPHANLQRGHGESIRIIDPKNRLTTPPIGQHAEAGDLDLENQQERCRT